ncbi:hypothetical protein ACFX10_040374 [Malus domestica]
MNGGLATEEEAEETTDERVLKMMKVREEITPVKYRWNQNGLSSEKMKKIESSEKKKNIECLDKMMFLPFKAVTWIAVWAKNIGLGRDVFSTRKALRKDYRGSFSSLAS